MHMLSALDATFIYLESEHSPMAIGGVYVIDASDAPAGFSYDSWYSLIESRLKCSKVFRQRLVEVPWDLSFPYWVRDPGFDLGMHLPRLRLPEPGGLAELMMMAADTWSRMLDRSRPLWEMTFVEGLNTVPGIAKVSFALITKVHHAAVDGKAGTEMMSALLDTTAEIREIEGEDDWKPEQLPSSLSVIIRSWSRAGLKAIDMAGFIGKVALGTAHLYRDKRLRKLDSPPRLLTAPSSIFNQPIASQRTFWGKNFDFDRFRTIRKAVPGATINDVVLAVCAGGLRNYLLGKKALPRKPLVAMAPISVRSKEDKECSGNQVSAMLVSLATDLDEPVDRLLDIKANTQRSKIQASALPANQITEFLPSETLAAAARVYTRTRLGGRHRPFFNVTITNVPGPPISLYVAGARIHSVFGMAPILDGLGLILVIFSYHGRLSIGISSCRQMVPDPACMVDCISRSLDDLENAVRQADPDRLAAEYSDHKTEPQDSRDSLKAFRDASQALDKAIESLENTKNEKDRA